MKWRLFFVTFLLFAVGLPLQADDAVPSAAELGRIFRTLLVPNLPDPLVDQNIRWDQQRNLPNGLTWKTKGILLKPELQRKMLNDGVWRKIAVRADEPDKSLKLSVKDVQIPETGRLTFTMRVELTVNIKFEQQLWRSGSRLYSGETRARCKVVLDLACESTSRVERQPNSFLPDLVMRLRVLDAKLNYYDFVTEHTAGVGGDLAKIIGNGAHDTIKSLKPSLEKDLLAKANSAIVKAGDTKEVRLSFSRLLDGKK